MNLLPVEQKTRHRAGEELRDLARRHLWFQNTDMAKIAGGSNFPIFVRGEGCHLWDSEGKRYIDGLSGLFCVNVGHGRSEIANAGAEQASELEFFPNWSAAHPPVIELAAKVAERTPAGLDRVFFTSGGGESVESALKMARHFHRLTGNGTKYKVISRINGYHGTTMGALSLTGVPRLRSTYEPLLAGGCHVPTPDVFRLEDGRDPLEFAEAVRERIEFEGPETVAAVILEPIQNSGGCITPPEGYFQRIREICDEHNVLLISDDVICSWGRLGEWFGGQRYGYTPDIITTAKGMSSSYAQMGAVIASERVFAPFAEHGAQFAHGYTWGGHPVAAAVSLANIAVLENENLNEHVRRNEEAFAAMLDSLRDIPIVGDIRGAGYFWAIELVKDQDSKTRFTAQEARVLIHDCLSPGVIANGLHCRCDDRGVPVIQLAPPLIAGPEEFAEIEAALRPALHEAAKRFLGTRNGGNDV